MDVTMMKKDESESSYYYYSSSSLSSGCSQSQLTSSPWNLNCPSENSALYAEATEVAAHKRKAGRKKFRETRHPVYRGVRQRNGNKWVCEVREPNKKSRIWLGTYPTPEMAARAHDVAALALKGTSAHFNFPDSVSLLPVAKSSAAADIRVAASQVSKVFGPTPTTPSANDESKAVVFFDEEAFYNMPGLLVSMAEGLLITPPSIKPFDWDEVQTDLTLWTY
ncbi:hypothetical protein VNO78_14069 [Psophocarpus tetragonolobus]|uniref:AP2/ERF domain-containing protein n=1 Tax=Psophocarpus tetragonolobus TaxID=3891 RepID=A0AAN9XQ74_PSOTE